MVSRTILRNEITTKLGEGGMGEVYFARFRTYCKVALKVLPQAEAVMREAKRASVSVLKE